MKSMYKLAEGVYDYLPDECYSLESLKTKLSETFAKRGYRKIETPIMERYDIFSGGVGYVPNNKLFKMTDCDGSLLVLRPDMTMPIARVMNTKMRGIKNAKLYYVSNCFSLNAGSYSMREFTQAGVELFAPSSPYVDADIIALAITAMENSGLKNFQIDIGNVAYFKGLLSALDLNEEDETEVIKLVDSKDSFGLEIFAKQHNIDKHKLQAILALPTLFGGKEVLKLAREKTDCIMAKEAIDNLSLIYEILVGYGYEKYISFDLSLVNGISYYSGVVFKGITRYFGATILSGGRYDNLSDSFNNSLSATGFAIGVNNLLSAIKNENGTCYELPYIDLLVGGEFSEVDKINEIINNSIENGLITEKFYTDDFVLFTEYVLNNKIKKGIYIDKSGKVNEVTNG